jgi:hypothetical protein
MGLLREYIIPFNTLTPHLQNFGPEAPIIKGPGKIVISHAKDTQVYLTIPFTVE